MVGAWVSDVWIDWKVFSAEFLEVKSVGSGVESSDRSGVDSCRLQRQVVGLLSDSNLFSGSSTPQKPEFPSQTPRTIPALSFSPSIIVLLPSPLTQPESSSLLLLLFSL